MTQEHFVVLDGRGVLTLSGDDRVTFLQGLVSNDMTRVGPDAARHTAFLTAQGKYLHDFFVVAGGEVLMLDVERDRRADLAKRLTMYKLRSKVTLSDQSEAFAVAAVLGDGAAQRLGLPETPGAAAPFGRGVAFLDPRLAQAGARVILPAAEARASLGAAGFAEAPFEAYERRRIALGLPDGSRDQEVDKAILLENGYSELGSVDWDKGCYLGQELTARTRYRGLVKKRLAPVEVDGPLPPPGTPVRMADKEVGELRSGIGGVALALLRLEAFEATAPLHAGAAAVTPRKPAWAEF